jgi:hypothetical protein
VSTRWRFALDDFLCLVCEVVHHLRTDGFVDEVLERLLIERLGNARHDCCVCIMLCYAMRGVDDAESRTKMHDAKAK